MLLVWSYGIFTSGISEGTGVTHCLEDLEKVEENAEVMHIDKLKYLNRGERVPFVLLGKI